jgi:hypothetical protein
MTSSCTPLSSRALLPSPARCYSLPLQLATHGLLRYTLLLTALFSSRLPTPTHSYPTRSAALHRSAAPLHSTFHSLLHSPSRLLSALPICDPPVHSPLRSPLHSPFTPLSNRLFSPLSTLLSTPLSNPPLPCSPSSSRSSDIVGQSKEFVLR